MSAGQWATYDDAARLVRVRPDLIRQWVRRGRVDATRIGRRVLVDLGHVRRAEADLRTTGPRPGRARSTQLARQCE